jgi:hypothetical protein
MALVSLKQESTSPAGAYACRGNYSYSPNVKHPYWMMPSQSPHPVTPPVIRNIPSLGNRQNQQKHGLSRNSQPPPAKRRVSILAGKRDSYQGGSSVASPIQGQNSTPSSSLNNSPVADITQRVTSTPSARQRRSIITLPATRGASSRYTPVSCGITQTDSTGHIVSSPSSGIASTPTLLSSPEIRPTPIPNPEACAIITNPLRTRATEGNQ